MVRKALAFLALAACGPAACSGGGTMPGSGTQNGKDTGTARPPALVGGRPAWRTCDDLPRERTGGPAAAPRFECATVRVPLDYAAPGGATIALALIRVKATGPGRRLGSLIFNFGGPGGSGIDGLIGAAGDYRALGARYDLVAFDPRGVGRSAPVTCVDDRRMDELMALDDSPDTTAEERALAASLASFARGCQARSGGTLPYVGTIAAARDLDTIRAALGDRRLHYFGISYGTWLGGAYAHRTPRNLGRAVLDGGVDTGISNRDLDLQQAAAFQRALESFARSCARQSCPLGQEPGAVISAVRGFLEGLDAHPLRTDDPSRRLTQSLGQTAVLAGLYSEGLWPVLTRALTRAIDGRDGTTLLTLADLQLGRRDDGRYTNLVAAATAITCADTSARYTVRDVRRALPRFRSASPIFGPAMAWSLLECTGWPVKGNDASKRVSAPRAAPILVVGNTGDPATPYAWARALTEDIGGKAALLTLKGQGHGAYETGNPCIRKAVNRYLIDGIVPKKGTTCG